MEEDDPGRESELLAAAIDRAGLRRPVRDWEKFRGTHREWLARHGADPVYGLPDAAIARMELPSPGHPPLLDRRDAAVERGLLALCHLHHAVGFGTDGPIVYPYFLPSPWRSVREFFPDMDWTEAEWASVAAAEMKPAVANFRLKGYAGWLVTEPPFLAAVAALEARWRALPAGLRPAFPLRRTTPTLGVAGRAGPRPAPAEVAAFAADRDAFLDRWGLLGLAAWDLPEPQGPLIFAPLPAGAPALPAHGVHIVVPLHYPLAGDDDLHGQILAFQRGLVADIGLDRTAAGLPYHGAYATMLEVVHWEQVIRGRFAPGYRRPGFVGLVVEAVAAAIDREINLVLKWRKVVASCRRGRRPSIKALRVAAD